MHPHKILAKRLHCSRLSIDQAMTMLNLIAAMGYLSLSEKALLIDIIGKKTKQQDIPRHKLLGILEQCPLSDLSIIQDESVQKILVFGLGNSAVAEWIPEALQTITGDAPAEPDEEEIAKVHAEMWLEEPATASEEPDETEQAAEDSQKTEIEYSSLDTQRWEIIFRGYDPIQGQHHYTMLRCGAKAKGKAFSSLTGGMGMQEDLPLLSEEWNAVEDRLRPYHQHFQTPNCEEEEQLIKDLVRRNGPFDCVFLLGFRQGQPNPARLEKLEGPNIYIQRERRFSIKALSSTADCHIQTSWPGGISLHKDGKELNWHAFSQRQRKSRESWQAASFWQLNFKQVHGAQCAIPLRWKLTSEQQQQIQADGGQRGHLKGRSGLFTEILHDQTFLTGTGHRGLPPCVHSGFDSHHMSILQGENSIDLRECASIFFKEQQPTIRTTPPINFQEHQTSSVQQGQGTPLHGSTVIEQYSSAKETDNTNTTNAFYRNNIQLLTGIELLWGDDNNGFHCVIEVPKQLAVAEEYINDSETVQHIDIHLQGIIETLPSIGQIHISSPEQKKEYALHFVTYKNQAHFQQQYSAHTLRERGWTQHFESGATVQEDSTLQHHLILSRASVGFQVLSSS